MNKTNEIDLDSLGTYIDDDAPVDAPPADEKRPVEAPPADEPPADEPEPDIEPGDEPEDEDEFEDLTLEELDDRIKGSLKSVIEDFRKQPPPGAEPSDTPPAVKELAEKNAQNEARIAELEEALALRQLGDLEHSIASTIGKLKMTKAEVQGTTRYMELHADATRKGMTFEEAATLRYPGIDARGRQAAAGPKAGDTPPAPPAANGSGAPGPFKSTPTPGDYSDITAHILKSGKAGSLGRYI